MRKYILVIILFVVAAVGGYGQTDRDLVRKGNKLYAVHKYAEAEVAYRKAIALSPQNSRAIYNLGCVLQKENRDSDAVRQYEQAVKLEPNENVRSQAYYNMGVALQQSKDYSKAIEAYKNCLRLNPSDNDARYNYVVCKRQQKQQQQQSGKNDKNNNNDKKQQNKNDKDKNQNNKKQPDNSQQNGGMSKDNAEQLLQAAMNEERQTEAKLKKAMQQPSRQTLDKNW